MGDQDDARDLTRLYAALTVLEEADDELGAMGEHMDGVAAALLQAQAAVVSMRMRIRRLRNPYFRQRMERFHHGRQGQAAPGSKPK